MKKLPTIVLTLFAMSVLAACATVRDLDYVKIDPVRLHAVPHHRLSEPFGWVDVPVQYATDFRVRIGDARYSRILEQAHIGVADEQAELAVITRFAEKEVVSQGFCKKAFTPAFSRRVISPLASHEVWMYVECAT